LREKKGNAANQPLSTTEEAGRDRKKEENLRLLPHRKMEEIGSEGGEGERDNVIL